MQKLNIGNMTTNAMQTLSIAGTTAAGMHRANEDRKLVNKLSGREYLSPEDIESIGKANAARQVQNARMYESGAGSYTEEEEKNIASNEAARRSQAARMFKSGSGMYTEEQENLITSAGADARYEAAKAYWENKNAVEDAMEGAPTAQSENIKILSGS